MRVPFWNRSAWTAAALLLGGLLSPRLLLAGAGEDAVVKLLQENRPYHKVTPEMFEQLGWDLPDGGATVKALADAAPGSAFDPRKLESIPAEKLGYRAK